MRLLPVIACAAALGACSYPGTSKVDRAMLDRLVVATERLEPGMTRDEAMDEFPAGQKRLWGEGHADDDPGITYEEWRIHADDSYERASELDPYREFTWWLYFRDGVLISHGAERFPLSDHKGVVATWARRGELDPFGRTIPEEER